MYGVHYNLESDANNSSVNGNVNQSQKYMRNGKFMECEKSKMLNMNWLYSEYIFNAMERH